MKKKKIMIVDDDREFLEELREILDLSGYHPVATTDSITFMEQVRMAGPDLILLDLKMEGKDGFQVAEELASDPETRNLPVIAITGFYSDEAYFRLKKFCRVEKCMQKPLNPLNVISEIEQALRGSVQEGARLCE